MKIDLLKLSPGYWFAWLVLWAILVSKVFLIRETDPKDFAMLAIFGVVMLVTAYAGAWVAWLLRKRDMRTGEITYLAILALFFIVRSIFLYREAMGRS